MTPLLQVPMSQRVPIKALTRQLTNFGVVSLYYYYYYDDYYYGDVL